MTPKYIALKMEDLVRQHFATITDDDIRILGMMCMTLVCSFAGGLIPRDIQIIEIHDEMISTQGAKAITRGAITELKKEMGIINKKISKNRIDLNLPEPPTYHRHCVYCGRAYGYRGANLKGTLIHWPSFDCDVPEVKVGLNKTVEPFSTWIYECRWCRGMRTRRGYV